MEKAKGRKQKGRKGEREKGRKIAPSLPLSPSPLLPVGEGGGRVSHSSTLAPRLLPAAFCLLLTAFFLLPVHRASAQAPERPPTDASAPADRDTIAVPRKSPIGAMVRSLALPGWGQLYNEHPIKGGLIAAAEAGAFVAYMARRERVVEVGQSPRSERSGRLLLTFVGLIFYSAVDAYVDAYLYGFEEEEQSVGVGLREGRGTVGVALRARF